MTRQELYLGIEFGSTRIKAVLLNGQAQLVAKAAFDWENQYVDGIWTYKLPLALEGLQAVYAGVAKAYREQSGAELTELSGIGISGMMHGYLPFDQEGRQLAGFRTWRNTMTQEAATELSEVFDFHIPQRWSIAHFYQAILKKESHVAEVASLKTLAGYLHWRLTGEHVLGVGEASGMFPIGAEGETYDLACIEKFDALLRQKNLSQSIADLLPRVVRVGEVAGRLSEEGARLLDPSGHLKAGVPFCPPEGDAGTGMVATNTVAVRSGNVSAGTSIFAMIVLNKALSKRYEDIDLVCTPGGKHVAMVHCNNCTAELDAWIQLFSEVASTFGAKPTTDELYEKLYKLALAGESDAGGLVGYNYRSGEHITGLEEGRPLLVRQPNRELTLANLMRHFLYSSMATLRIGMEILEKEGVYPERLLGHGGLFKTEGVAQSLMATVLNLPMSVLSTAGEGGAYGVAVLALFMGKKSRGEAQTLEDYLAQKVFGEGEQEVCYPNAEEAKGVAQYLEQYRKGLILEKLAVQEL